VLVSLLLCNVFLFSRLWALEQSLQLSQTTGFSGMPFRDYRFVSLVLTLTSLLSTKTFVTCFTTISSKKSSRRKLSMNV
jgi:hypothetical protein